MNFWVYLLIVEIIPVGMFILGGLFETSSTKYPDTKIGYKNKYSLKDKYSWEYSNKLAAKIYGSAGTILFIISAILLFIIGENTFTFILLFSLFIALLARTMIDKLINKKFDK